MTTATLPSHRDDRVVARSVDALDVLVTALLEIVMAAAVIGLAALSLLAAGFLLPFTHVVHDPNAAVASVLYAPMGLHEMVLAGWLIVRGFAPADVAPEVPA